MDVAVNRAKEAIDVLQNGEFGKLIAILTSSFLAFVTITILIIIIMNLVRLAHIRSNANAREQAIRDLGINFISLAIIGGIDLVVLLLFFII